MSRPDHGYAAARLVRPYRRFIRRRWRTRADVASTWRPGCPVAPSSLRRLSVSHWGFDGRAHLGELIVHRDAAATMLRVFRRLYDARYPIHRMHRVDYYSGSDDRSMAVDNTSGFNCRRATGSTTAGRAQLRQSGRGASTRREPIREGRDGAPAVRPAVHQSAPTGAGRAARRRSGGRHVRRRRLVVGRRVDIAQGYQHF